MSFNKSPHTLDSFWVERMKEVLANPYITPRYRKRCEVIYLEAAGRITKTGNSIELSKQSKMIGMKNKTP